MGNQLNAVLVNFSISGGWSARARDKKVTAEVAAQHNTSEDAGEWSKRLFPESAVGEDNPHARFKASISRAKTFHYDHSLPWEKPLALIRSDLHEKYDEMINVAMRQEVTKAAEEFFEAYEGMIQKARLALNGTFNEEDYPPLERLRKKFQYSVSYSPVPESGHFVDTIASPKLAKLRDELNAANERKLQAAVGEVWRRMLEPIQKLAEKMTENDPTFHDSLIGNIREMMALVPEINITNDGRIAEVARQINDALGTINPDALRRSQFARLDAGKKAVEIIGTFGQLGSRRLAA